MSHNAIFYGHTFYFIVIIGLSILVAILKGGIKDAFAFLALLLAFFITIKSFATIRPLIEKIVSNPILELLLIFVVVFILLKIFISVLERSILEFLNKLQLQGLNLIIALVFGFIRGVLICAVIVICINHFYPKIQLKKDAMYYLIQPEVTWLEEIIADLHLTKISKL